MELMARARYGAFVMARNWPFFVAEDRSLEQVVWSAGLGCKISVTGGAPVSPVRRT